MKTGPPGRIRRAAACVLAGMAAILATRILRSHLSHPPESVTRFLVVLPNLAAGFALPSLIAVLTSWRPHSPPGRMDTARLTAFASAAVILLLTAWEAVQLWIWNLPFDPRDIIAGGAGILLSFAVNRRR